MINMNNVNRVSKMISSVIHGKCPVCGGKLYYVSTTIEEMDPDILKCENCKKELVNETFRVEKLG